MKRPGIYIIRNLLTGVVYVGQSACTAQRLRQHRHRLKNGTHTNPRLLNAWNKYGEEAFEFLHIETIEANASRIAREVVVLAAYRATCGVYNLSDGGEGQPQSQESRAKISAARMGMKFSDETKRRISDSQRGRKIPQWWRDKLRAASYWRGKKRPPRTAEHCAKLSAARKGKAGTPHTPESKRKLSKALKGRTYSQNALANMRAGRLRYIANGGPPTRVRLITYSGVTLSVCDWAKRIGISRESLSFRLNNGWPIARALNEPARGG